MCIIIYKPKGATLTREIYENSFEKNDDGAGFAYIRNGEIVVDKGYFSFGKFYAALKEFEDDMLLVHFRIATHGDKGKDNCHPFSFTLKSNPRYSYVVAHNGQLPYRSTKDKSDTNLFTNEFLREVLEGNPNFLDCWAGHLLIEKFIGTNNKIVVIKYDSEKNVYTTFFFNKLLGNEKHGCWFSNYSYEKWNNRHTNFPSTGYGYGYGDGFNAELELERHESSFTDADRKEYAAVFLGWTYDKIATIWRKDGATRTIKEMNDCVMAEFKSVTTRARYKKRNEPKVDDKSTNVVNQSPPPLRLNQHVWGWRKNYQTGMWEGLDNKGIAIPGRTLTETEFQSRNSNGTPLFPGVPSGDKKPDDKQPIGDDKQKPRPQTSAELDALTTEEWKIEMEIRAKELEDSQKTYSPSFLEHLELDQRITIRKMAYDCMRDHHAEPIGKSEKEKIIWFRDKCREIFPMAKQITDIELDKWIVGFTVLDASGKPIVAGAGTEESIVSI